MSAMVMVIITILLLILTPVVISNHAPAPEWSSQQESGKENGIANTFCGYAAIFYFS